MRLFKKTKKVLKKMKIFKIKMISINNKKMLNHKNLKKMNLFKKIKMISLYNKKILNNKK